MSCLRWWSEGGGEDGQVKGWGGGTSEVCDCVTLSSSLTHTVSPASEQNRDHRPTLEGKEEFLPKDF